MRPEPGAQAASQRASRADRERVIDLLKAAFVQGRLDRDEFDVRVGRTLGSRTYGELAAVTADIPAELIGALPRHPPVRVRRRITMNTAITGAAFMVPLIPAALLAATLTGSSAAVIVVAVLMVVAAILAIAAIITAPSPSDPPYLSPEPPRAGAASPAPLSRVAWLPDAYDVLPVGRPARRVLRGGAVPVAWVAPPRSAWRASPCRPPPAPQ